MQQNTNAGFSCLPANGGYFAEDVAVSLQGSETNTSASTRLMDRNQQVENGAIYEGKFTFVLLRRRLSLRARAVVADGTLGPIGTASYAVGLSLPALSLVMIEQSLGQGPAYTSFWLRGLDFDLTTWRTLRRIQCRQLAFMAQQRAIQKKSYLHFFHALKIVCLCLNLWCPIFSAEILHTSNSLTSLKRLDPARWRPDYPAPDFGCQLDITAPGQLPMPVADEMGQCTTAAQPAISVSRRRTTVFLRITQSG